MAVIESSGALATLGNAWRPTRPTSVRMYAGLTQDYATIYRTQPNVRTVVDFFARNVGQIGLHVFRRVSDTDRERLTDHQLALTLRSPNPFTTPYRLWVATVTDRLVFGNALWAKVSGTGRQQIAIARVPWARVMPVGDNWMVPDVYRIRTKKGPVDLKPEQVVHFRYYDPELEVQGVPPLETLRRILAEESAAGEWREQFWQNAARIDGVLTRPANAPKWSPDARERFLGDWRSRYAAQGPDAGGDPVLEDGMNFKTATFSPEQSQYLQARKLSREECASAFHVQPAMVGILEHANFANIREQHQMLYQDTLGPELVADEQEVELQLMPDFDDVSDVYVEFNIAEKLKGSFEEQLAALTSAVGRPYMTGNEGRARLNLPRIEDPTMDTPVLPLNVLAGGQPAPNVEPARQAAARAALPAEAKAAPRVPVTAGLLEKHRQVLRAFFERQSRTVLSRAGAAKDRKAEVDEVFDQERWDAELFKELLALAFLAAQEMGDDVADEFGSDYDVHVAGDPWLTLNATFASEAVNAQTASSIEEALGAEDPAAALRDVFAEATSSRTDQLAQSRVTAAGNFGRQEAAKVAGARRKTWVVTSARPRPSHAALGGATVDMNDRFANGGRWPGDPELSADEAAGCTCALGFTQEAS